MPRERKRYTADGKPAHCVVRINPVTAQFLYREARIRGYRDETELANEILRQWSLDLDPMDWPKLLKQMKADDELEGKSEAG